MISARFKPYPAYRDSGIEWLGKIPVHWEIRRLKDHGALVGGAGFPHECQGVVGEDLQFYKVGDLRSSSDGRKMLKGPNSVSHDVAAKLRASVIPAGAILWAKIGAALFLNRRRVTTQPCCIDNNLTAYIPDGIRVSTDWALYWTSSLDFRRLANPGAVPSLSEGYQSTLPLVVPPMEEQYAITDFLDRETAKIDALVAKKERLIELLQEKRTALITHAVTKGLDSNVPMRGSGIEWLGQIPAHWHILRNALLFDQRDERGYPELPLLNVSIATGVQVRVFSDEHIEQKASDHSIYKRAAAGDIAFNKMRMWQGAVGVVPVDGLVSPDYTVAAARSGVCAQYYCHLFRTCLYMAKVYCESHGIVDDRNRLYWDGFRDIRGPVPPSDEQQQIVDFLDRETAKIDALIAKVGEAIERLKEYRTALISAVVTGKIDVRNE